MPNAKVLSEKQAIVADLAEQMKNASAGVLVDYRGITVADDTALLGAVIKAKPAAAKGQYIRSCVVASTMGPGVKVNAAKL